VRPLILDLRDAEDGLRSVFNLLRAPIVRPPIVNLGNTENRLPSVFGLLEVWIGARADAEQLFFSEMRNKVARMPLLDAGLELAEVISKQQSDLAHLLVNLVECAVVPPRRSDMQRAQPAYSREPAVGAYDRREMHRPSQAYAGEPGGAVRGVAEVQGTRPASVCDPAVAARGHAEVPRVRPAHPGERANEDYARTADLRSDFAQRGQVLRLTIPQGTRGVAVPVRLRNHRQFIDRVLLSAVEPSAPGVATIPSQLICFDPETLDIPPLSEGSVQLLVRLGPGFEQAGEYWSEVVINGTETKRVPLSLRIVDRPDAQPDGI
jgi:hypothetical protein